MTKSPLKVLVMQGGTSNEREVSLRSGAAIARALTNLGHLVETHDPATDGLENLAARGQDLIFFALHGGEGENGTIQAILEHQHLAYTGSGPLASGIAMDKEVAKRLFVQAGIPTPAWQKIRVGSRPESVTLAFPLVVKPVSEGSSIGVTIVRDRAELGPALEKSWAIEPFALVETFIPGDELTVPVLGDPAAALPIVRIRPKSGTYDYSSKYTTGMTEYECPAEIDPEAARRVSDYALRAHLALGCAGYSRVDVRLSPDGQPSVLEVNTLPGMTETSLFPKSVRAAGSSFEDLMQTLCDLALARHGFRKRAAAPANVPAALRRLG